MTAIVVSDDVLNGLLENPKFKDLPCLQFRLAGGANKPCNCAGKAKTIKNAINGEHARICIFQLQPPRLAELKAALAADQLVVYMNTPGFPRRALL